MIIYGYARVSSLDQNVARQLDAFDDFGISPENIFIDKQSGKTSTDKTMRHSCNASAKATCS